MDKLEILEELKQKKENGTKIVGIMAHQMVPEEIIHASGALPMRISFSGSEEICMKGMEYLTAITCPLTRSILGFLEEGHEFLSLIDAFIGGNYCNGDLCGSEYITKYFNIPLIRLPIPWVNNPKAIQFYRTSLQNLKKNLEKTLNVQISQEQIHQSMNLYNQIREKLHKHALEFGMGADFQDILNEFYLLGPERLLQRLNDYERDAEKQSSGDPEIAFTGSYVGFGDPILNVIEECGFFIKYNDSESIFYHENAVPGGDSLESLANFYLSEHYSSRMFDTTQRVQKLISQAKSLQIKGIILHVLKFCDPYVGTKHSVKNQLKNEDFAVLELERDYTQSTGQITTRLEAFREMLE
ncbi:MAG: 2-hydroxyacyl-CoA dehydratase subunit D [Candidatus Helarchaeota archaeon]